MQRRHGLYLVCCSDFKEFDNCLVSNLHRGNKCDIESHLFGHQVFYWKYEDRKYSLTMPLVWIALTTGFVNVILCLLYISLIFQDSEEQDELV